MIVIGHTPRIGRYGRNLIGAVIAPALILHAAASSAAVPDPAIVIWTTSTCDATETQGPAPASFLAGLLGLVLAPAIEAGIKGLGEAIAKAGAPSDIHAQGQFGTHLYKVTIPEVVLENRGSRIASPSGQLIHLANGQDLYVPAEAPSLSYARSCVIVAAGPQITGAPRKPVELQEALSARDAPPLGSASAHYPFDSAVLKEVSSVLESSKTSILVAEIIPALDRTAFQLKPRAVRLGQSLDGKTKTRTVAFTVSILPPGALTDGTAAAVRTISFPKIGASRDVPWPEAGNFVSSWIPNPPIPDEGKAQLAAVTQRMTDIRTLADSLGVSKLKPAERLKAEADLRRLVDRLTADRDKLAEVAPYTLRGDVHQTRPGSPFLTKLGTLLAGNADKLAAPIANRLNAETRAAEAETELQKVEALRVAAIMESANWAKAVSSGDAAAARIAELKLRAACRQIDGAGFSEAACLAGS